MLERLVYVSRAAPGIGSRETYDIVRSAYNRNGHVGLTGALLFLDGHFAQVLEGDPYHLNERFEVIRRDPRHVDIDLRSRITVASRSFADDWMALRHGDDVPDDVRNAFGYVPGFPAAHFPAERLLAFVRACCDATARVT